MANPYGNKYLRKANEAKEDEFYTKITDIEKELRHYITHFKDATIFCNCDDPEYSNFWRYFQLNFYEFGIKKLISTHYEAEKPSYKMEIVATDHKEQLGIPDYIKTPLKQNGDFRSPECIEILKEADIVITNPPFSLFREYVAQLMEYKKQFVIISSQNNMTYKEIFPLLRDDKIWTGYNNGDMEFSVPDYYEPRATRYREENGVKYRSMGNICWLTNLEIQKRHENITLFKTYLGNEEEYPHYYNYDAINVNRVEDIPIDYDGEMGVPVTFLQRYNPDQFEIIGVGSGYLGQSIGIKGILPEHKKMMKGHSAAGDLYYIKNGVPKVPYSRILIRRKRQ